MAGNYARLFSTYTSEQLLELASQRDTLLDAGKAALDEEMKRRGFDPHELLTSVVDLAVERNDKTSEINSISRFFLRGQSWQVFLLIFVPYCLAILGLITGAASAPANSSQGVGAPGLSFGIPVLFSLLCYLGRLGSLGSFLNAVVHPALRMKMKLFRFSIIYPALYIPVFFAFVARNGSRFVAIGVCLYLLVMFCMIYILYFAAKNLVLAERGKPVSFYDYAGPIFLLWFIPLGIWVIQPRINRLYRGTAPHSTEQVAAT
jgi:hypothetical protein